MRARNEILLSCYLVNEFLNRNDPEMQIPEFYQYVDVMQYHVSNIINNTVVAIFSNSMFTVDTELPAYFRS